MGVHLHGTVHKMDYGRMVLWGVTCVLGFMRQVMEPMNSYYIH